MKSANKSALAQYLGSDAALPIDPASLYDVQVKRFHEYKRQHLNILQVIASYLRLRARGQDAVVACTCLFGGTAAPSYHMAKLIIRLIYGVAEVVHNDALAHEALRVVFIPNFNVSSGQRIYPAAELSEQISTAGKEASGTGNMKFQMNGALTIGTLDGANIEICDAVGAENFFLFGHDAAQLRALRLQGNRPMDYVEADPELRAVLEAIDEGQFSNGDRELFRPLTDGLRGFDPYMVLADFRSYVDCQQRVAAAYADTAAWTRMAILNCARSGYFISDRTIDES